MLYQRMHIDMRLVAANVSPNKESESKSVDENFDVPEKFSTLKVPTNTQSDPVVYAWPKLLCVFWLSL